MTPYTQLASIDVSAYVEKKNGLTYLSWAWAVDQLMRQDSSANWEFHDPVAIGETMLVSCSVTAFGKTMKCHLPVMDHRNKAIAKPDAFSVNTAMQRCLVKAIALHGLGLYIYAGEDVPQAIEPNPRTPVGAAMAESAPLPKDQTEALYELAAELVDLVEGQKEDRIAYLKLMDQNLDQDQKLALWAILAPNSKTRSALKREADKERAAA